MRTNAIRTAITAGAAGLVLLVGAGGVSAQTAEDDDCYPIPDDGCFDDGAADDGAADDGAADDGEVEDSDEQFGVGGATPPTPVSTTPTTSVLARTGGVTGLIVLIGTAGVLGGLALLAIGRRRQAT
jgi:hypothetical protein